jgi:hypothetical protein
MFTLIAFITELYPVSLVTTTWNDAKKGSGKEMQKGIPRIRPDHNALRVAEGVNFGHLPPSPPSSSCCHWSIDFMGWDYVSELLPLTDILFIPQMVWVWRATVECYWQGKTKELGENPVPVPFCPPQILYGLTRARTRASAVRGRRLTVWAMARPKLLLY